MSSFRQLMMKPKSSTPIPPANTIMTKAGDNTKISNRTYTKTYDGLAYCCCFCFQDSGRTWQGVMLVSEVQQNCEMMAGNYAAAVSNTPFSYKGKQWYYIQGIAAMGTTSAQNNGRYFLNNGEIFTGSDAYLNAAKALLDYIYSFSKTDFVFVDYIETTGTQYIDTWFVPTSNTRTVTKIKTTTTSQAIIVFGCANSTFYYYMVPYANKWYYGIAGSESSAGTYNGVIGNEYEIDFNNSGTIIVNNTTIVSNIRPSGNGNLWISKRSDNLYGQWQYKSFKIYESGVLVRDFVPAYRISTNQYVFVDTVYNAFYENAGTGNLGGGN